LKVLTVQTSHEEAASGMASSQKLMKAHLQHAYDARRFG
jgi:hypothetical protein